MEYTRGVGVEVNFWCLCNIICVCERFLMAIRDLAKKKQKKKLLTTFVSGDLFQIPTMQ